MTASAVARAGDWFRRRSGLFALLVALALLGGAYASFAPKGAAAERSETATSAMAAKEGQKLYNQSCITCHGANAEGVTDRGPSLIGVGAAAVEFQVGTGRMPMARQEAQAERKQPQFSADETSQLAAYIEALGGGPKIPDEKLRSDDLAEGGKLFRVNCASCHAFSTHGGALSSGKYAPDIALATDRQIYAAMLTGPQNMPVFGDNEISPEQKKAIIAYIQTQNEDADPGGFGISRTGPVPEGLVVFLVGMVLLLFATLWIAGKKS